MHRNRSFWSKFIRQIQNKSRRPRFLVATVMYLLQLFEWQPSSFHLLLISHFIFCFTAICKQMEVAVKSQPGIASQYICVRNRCLIGMSPHFWQLQNKQKMQLGLSCQKWDTSLSTWTACHKMTESKYFPHPPKSLFITFGTTSTFLVTFFCGLAI